MTSAISECLRTLDFLAAVTDTSVVGKALDALEVLEAAHPNPSARAGALVELLRQVSHQHPGQPPMPFQRFVAAMIEQRLDRLRGEDYDRIITVQRKPM